MTIGMLFAFLAYKTEFDHRAGVLLDRLFEFRMLGAHADRLADIVLHEPEENRPRSVRVAAPLSPGSVDVDQVCYRYDASGPLVISSFTLHVRAGEFVAIVGPSGSGKTTLMKIICGLLRPEGGSVLIGGPAIGPESDIPAGYVGVVLQEDTLFSGTISQNINFFDALPDVERVRECARIACIGEEIMAMPMGFNSLVGPSGEGVSGGQKQRILIARALYRAPRILVLDEATSHLDIETEAKIMRNLSATGATRIVAAHRPEAIASADRAVDLHGQTLGEIPGLPARGLALVPETVKTGETI
ncbi:MAG: ATP-binding cassette domain-containing protein [Terriglobales bacterium]